MSTEALAELEAVEEFIETEVKTIEDAKQYYQEINQLLDII